jgi:hypothetical protein
VAVAVKQELATITRHRHPPSRKQAKIRFAALDATPDVRVAKSWALTWDPGGSPAILARWHGVSRRASRPRPRGPVSCGHAIAA